MITSGSEERPWCKWEWVFVNLVLSRLKRGSDCYFCSSGIRERLAMLPEKQVGFNDTETPNSFCDIRVRDIACTGE